MSWPMMNIGEVADVLRGVTFSKGDASDAPSAGVPILRAGNIQDTLILDEDLVYLSEDFVSEKQKIIEGDIVMCMSSGSASVLGKSALVKASWNGSFGAFLSVIRARPEVVDPSYLSHYFRLPTFRSWASASNGIGIKNIRLSDLAAHEIPLPPLEEQKRIAGILDQADALRRLRARALEKLNTLGQAVFQEMFGGGCSHPSVPLGSIIASGDKINYGVVQPGDNVADGVPLLRAGDVTNNPLDQKNFRRVSAEVDLKHKKSRLHGDEILIACVGSIGAIGLAHEGLRGVNIARAVARVRVDPRRAAREFIASQLKSASVQNYFQSEIRLVAQPTLNIKQISECEIVLPPLEEQKAFESRISEIYPIIRHAEKAVVQSTTLFASLQSAAFQGKL